MRTLDDAAPTSPSARPPSRRSSSGWPSAPSHAYRDLVHDDPDFVDFFRTVTPVDEISRLRLGSRPARRAAASGIDDLRAIPWVFSWTQARIVLPAWFGLGTALERARRGGLERAAARWSDDWPFFAALLSNAEMACAKADLAIARATSSCGRRRRASAIWAARSPTSSSAPRRAAAVCGEERLLDREPVLQASIERRNPYVDPLSFVQIELLRRLRADGAGADGDSAGSAC